MNVFQSLKKWTLKTLLAFMLFGVGFGLGCAGQKNAIKFEEVSFEQDIKNYGDYKKSLEHIFEKEDNIDWLWHFEVPVWYVQEVARIKDKEGNQQYTHNDIVHMAKNKVPPAYVKHLSDIKDQNGQKVPVTSIDIVGLWEARNRLLVEEIKTFAKITNAQEEKVFFKECKSVIPKGNYAGGDLIADFTLWGGTHEYAEALAKMKNPKGKPLFDGCSIVSYLYTHAPIEEADYLSSLLNSMGEPLLPTGYHIADFIRVEGTREKAQTFAKSPYLFTPEDIVMYILL